MKYSVNLTLGVKKKPSRLLQQEGFYFIKML